MPTLSSSTCLNPNSDDPIPSITLYLSMIITILNLLLSITIPQASGTYQPMDVHSDLTYNFPVVSGLKFVRLYFYPVTYLKFNSSASFFSVTANGYTLLSNFSAYLTVFSINHQAFSFFKEFVITVWETEQLKITFTQLKARLPSNLYTKDLSLISYPLVNDDDLFYFDNTTALENSYRLNVGGRFITSVHDSGMFRKWLDDTNSIFGNVGVVESAENNLKNQISVTGKAKDES